MLRQKKNGSGRSLQVHCCSTIVPSAEAIGGRGRKILLVQDGIRGPSYPFPHQAVVEGQADELEGRLLDEVGVEDSDLRGLPGYVVRHRLPEPFRALLRCL